jgi:hypothetical protein
LDGLRVALAYQRHVEHGISLMDGVLEYNEDDLRLVKHLVDRCFNLRDSSKLDYDRVLHYDLVGVYRDQAGSLVEFKLL